MSTQPHPGSWQLKEALDGFFYVTDTKGTTRIMGKFERSLAERISEWHNECIDDMQARLEGAAADLSECRKQLSAAIDELVALKIENSRLRERIQVLCLHP